MENPIRRYDPLWTTFNADDLKKMSVLWGASTKMPKADRIAYLIAAPNDPHLVDTALAHMLPHERAALALVKLLGGTADIGALGIAVRATGLVPDTERYHREYGTEPVARTLLERGIVIQEVGYRYIDYSYNATEKRVFADDRVLARLPPPDYSRLSLKAADPPTTSTFRRVPSVMLEVISILRAVDDLGGIGLTKAGDLRAHDLRKVTLKLGWGKQIKIDGLPFPEPMDAYIVAMSDGGLLALTDDALISAMSLEQVVRSPVPEILRSLMRGILQADDWLEVDAGYVRYLYERHCTTSRFAVVTALRCLPDRTAWFRFADFERALFERIGESHSVAGVKSRPYSSYGKTAAEQRVELDTWRQEIREVWEQSDVPWIQAVFRTWLYAFGLVELHLINGTVDRFRLTDLGRALLWEEAMKEQTSPEEIQTAAWVVQPNFDLVVYLESASTEQIAFLEQHAERLQVAQHTAQYRLTRDSVYEGLQRGGSADQLIERLAAGSRVPLPGNVQSEIRTWAALRERIVVRQHADLIEFPDATQRQNAIALGLQGLPVGDRFLLLSENYKPLGVLPDVIDYSHKPDKSSLLLAEDGVVTPLLNRSDLLTQGGLDLWAERESNSAWRLTCKSVEQAAQRGRKLPELQAFLQERLMVPIPGLLLVALQAWMGAPAEVGLSTAVVLQCTQPAALDALLKSKALKPHLLGRIGPDAILVKSADVDAVRAVLAWAGVPVSAKILGS